MIEVVNKTKFKFCQRKLKRLFLSFRDEFNLNDGEVSLVLVGDRKIRELNKQYRKIDKVTDILTFNASEEGVGYLRKNIYWGEIFINVLDLKRLKKYDEMFLEIGLKKSYSLKRQNYLFYFLIAHGLLHLAGFNDEYEKDRLKMLKIGKKLLDNANIN